MTAGDRYSRPTKHNRSDIDKILAIYGGSCQSLPENVGLARLARLLGYRSGNWDSKIDGREWRKLSILEESAKKHPCVEINRLIFTASKYCNLV